MDQKALNQYLQDRAYIEGSQPSQADRVVFEALKVLPSTEDFPHLARWFTHISSFEGKMDSFPGEAKDVAAYKAVVAKAVSSSSSSSSAPASMDPSSSETAEEKSEKQKKNDEKKKAKMEKFMAKKQKEGTSSQPKKKEEGQAEGAEAADKNPKKKKAPEVVPVDSTPKGEKKHLPAELPNSYHPKYVEAAWYDWWEKSGHFKPEKDGKLVANEKGVFVIPIPPPNVTGSLHLGHALTNSIQDALARWHRMRGETVLWNPGCDHAGIATQVVVEKKLQREQNKTRHDLGREEFVKKVWEYKEQYGGKIYNQLRRLGSSVDWDRAAFTMDEIRSRAVIEAFVRMYNMGLIYRSTRLVNWCSKLKTAISNLEVDYKELAGRELLHVTGHDPQKRYEFGVMIHFSYKVDGSDEEITVATTRIETMLGDTGIAVHPDDERYKHLHGKEVVHPFANRKFKIVPDTMVDMAFGTGAVKITPAHDPNDYEVGKRHNLPFINIFNDDGTINENGGKYQGMMRFDCRTAIIKDLEALGHFKQRVPNPMSIPVCSRTGDIIEPMIKPQWYVKINTMAKAALDCVESDELQIIPSQFKATWQRWLENPIDWCISRQLWWGHRIPAFLVKIKGRECDESNEANWVIARTPEQAMAAALEKFPDAKQEDIVLDQDPDVLDTWFSSGIFPFSIFGWPEETEEMKMFYPNTLLETGHDILFFWVARMVMMGITLTGKVPFKQVYLHAMVRDAHGRKMSKSLGNVIDPLDVIEGISLEGLHKQLEENTNLDPKEVEKAKKGQKEDFPNGIAECGTDALRFALCAYTMQARDINLDVKRVEGYRHFCNKIWNAFKFATMNLGAGYTPSQDSGLVGRSLSEKWILSRMNAAIKLCNDGFSKFTFPQATTAIYNFWLYELCDFYLELMKPVLFDTTEGKENEERKKSCKDVLYTCLDVGLRLLHPFMPFLTEELYQRLPRRPGFPSETICLAPYPEDTPAMDDTQCEEQFNKLMDAIKAIRSMRTSHYKPKDTVKVFISSSGSMEELLKSQVVAINTLCKSETEFLAAGAAPEHKCETNSLGEDCQLHLLLP